VNILTLFEVAAVKIKPFQKMSYFLAVIFITLLIVPLIVPTQAEFIGFAISDDYGKFALLGCIWLLLFNLVTNVFINIPIQATESDSTFRRIKLKLARFLYFILAMFFVVLTLTILFLSIRLLRV